MSRRRLGPPEEAFWEHWRIMRGANLKCLPPSRRIHPLLVLTNPDSVALSPPPSPPSRSSSASLHVFGNPTSPFTSSEFAALTSYVSSGGSLIFLLSEGGEDKSGCNYNYLLEQFGMSGASDSVVRTVYHKYLHPKQVYVANGVLNPAIATKKGAGRKKSKSGSKGKENAGGNSDNRHLTQEELNSNAGLTFVYPYGCSINVLKPAVPVLGSGPISFPMNRPVGGIYSSPVTSSSDKSPGRVVVLGSADMFNDEWIDKEENGLLLDVLVRYAVGDIDIDRGREVEIEDKKQVPDIEALAERLKPCLQEGEPLPHDFTHLFNDELFKFDTSKIPEAVNLYDMLKVKHEVRKRGEKRGMELKRAHTAYHYN